MISKELGFIDWTKPAVEIERLIRGLNPWPSAYTHLNGKTFKVWSAKVIDGSDDYEPGCIYHIGKMICMYRQERSIIFSRGTAPGQEAHGYRFIFERLSCGRGLIFHVIVIHYK